MLILVGASGWPVFWKDQLWTRSKRVWPRAGSARNRHQILPFHTIYTLSTQLPHFIGIRLKGIQNAHVDHRFDGWCLGRPRVHLPENRRVLMASETDQLQFDVRPQSGSCFTIDGNMVYDPANPVAGTLAFNVNNKAGKWIDVIVEGQYPSWNRLWTT